MNSSSSAQRPAKPAATRTGVLESADLLLGQVTDFSIPTLATPPDPFSGVVVGSLRGFTTSGAPQVDFAGNPENGPLPARAIVVLEAHQIGREVVLVFAGSDPRRPIVLGVLQPVREPPSTAVPATKPVEARLDGHQVVLAADKEIVLSCGKASITLTRSGKILISGEYLLSRSNGVNRIKGGSVQIN